MKLKDLKNEHLIKLAYNEEMGKEELKQFAKTHTIQETEKFDEVYETYKNKAVIFGVTKFGKYLAWGGLAVFAGSIIIKDQNYMFLSAFVMALGLLLNQADLLDDNISTRRQYKNAKAEMIETVKTCELLEK